MFRRNQLWLRRLVHRLRRWWMLVPISRVTSGPWSSVWSFRMKSVVVPSYLIWIDLRIAEVVVSMRWLLKGVIRCRTSVCRDWVVKTQRRCHRY
ncbi:hypothetical protein HanRHA438_Chr09g0430351 [Helianthus annuus]|nr:hypothetical protein HanRHA438_Chr09g0430351 [Helianthus annuus]